MIFDPDRPRPLELIPTQKADIYAFGLVIYQVCDHNRGHPPFAYISQVLTGELPFPGFLQAEMVAEGMRPTKPGNASTIGFSDSLWSFAQRYWDHRMEWRPEIEEVVSQLKRAVTSWNAVMSPCAHQEPGSDSREHSKFDILIFP